MLRRILGIARTQAMRGRTARPGMGAPRPGPRPGIGPRAGRPGPGAGGGADIERGVRSIVRGLGKRRRGL